MSAPRSEDELIAHLLGLPAAERAAALDDLIARQPGLQGRRPAILAALTHPTQLRPRPQSHLARNVLESALAAAPEDTSGAQIGPYKLLQEIGEGGFGTVWMAEQQAPIRRRVALKIIKLGMDTHEVIARFEAERQALALMDHPNIARVFDAGATDAGRPYFAMELVRGVPITCYCDENRLPAEARLRLFIAVCQAVQHAHQKGVIHRDLKPSNILVTLHDGVPVPKVIDFGIAKATHGHLTDRTLFTQFHAFMGTPAYTSPEQMEMSGLDVDTRSDIYSLGVLLYELLTGRPPFDPDALVKSGLEAMRRTIREIDPPRPSNRLTTLTDAERTSVAQLRGTDAGKLSLLLRGDPDWIVMRCLEKDRGRRYETANGLAMDIQRYLASEPVTARPPSLADQAYKFARRHRLMVAAAGAILASLVVGLGVALVGFRRAVNQQHAAEAARGQAEGLVGFIMRDLQPSLLAHGRLPVVKQTIQAAIRYFDDLPPEMRNHETMRGHAQALEALVAFSEREAFHPLGESDPRVAHAAAQRAWQFRRALVAADPNDADSAAAAIENERSAAFNGDFSDSIDTVKLNADCLRRYRELARRFPANLRVQRGLARMLSERGWWDHDLADASESAQRWTQIIVAHPEDVDLRIGHVFGLGGIAASHAERGNAPAATVAGEKALAAAQELLKSDPTDLRIISVVATMAGGLGWWSEPVARPRAFEATRLARHQYQRLIELDPTNDHWREAEMEQVLTEATLFYLGDQLELAQKTLDDLIARAQPAPTGKLQGTFMKLLMISGRWTTDPALTRTRLQTIRDGLKDYPLVYPERSAERAMARFAWWRAQARLADELQDWPELERLSRTMLDEMNRNLHDLPGAAMRFRSRQAAAKALLGKALLRRDNPREAVTLLEQAAGVLRENADWTFTDGYWDELPEVVIKDWPEALRLTGETGRAVRVLETALTEAEANLAKRPDRWLAHRDVVQVAVRLAEFLDPATPPENARRQAILDRAEGLFSGVEAESKMKPYDHELKAKVKSLRTAERNR